MYSIILITSIIILIISLILWAKTSKLKKDLKEKAITEIDWKTKQVEEAAALKQEELHKAIEENELVILQQEKHKQLLLEKGQQLIDKELDNYKFTHKNEVENEIYHYKTEELRKIDIEREKQKREIEKEKYEFNTSFKETKKNLEDYLTNRKTEINDEIIQLLLQKSEIEADLEDFRSRRAAVNEAILREKELQEQETFYKINLTQNDIEDIAVLREIEPRLCNKEALNRLIYDVFIKNPSQEMIKRVTKGKKISGIYKITYIKTGESYIGRSVDIGNRWKQHLLSSLNIGSIAHAYFHTILAEKGLHNFTFEIIEEVDKNKLNEREKYWIAFYETDKQLNSNQGG